MEESLITVAAYDQLIEADVARSVLEGSGIGCAIDDDGETAAGPILLKVRGPDARAAAAMLSSTPSATLVRYRPPSAEAACPNCGARSAERSYATLFVLLSVLLTLEIATLMWQRMLLPWVTVSALVLYALVGTMVREWRCAECSRRWRS
ncbi:MAG: hypothetical protein WBX15_12180 [Thermoanaerobaculia bacterium]